jgi:hypothetical protein
MQVCSKLSPTSELFLSQNTDEKHKEVIADGVTTLVDKAKVSKHSCEMSRLLSICAYFAWGSAQTHTWQH